MDESIGIALEEQVAAAMDELHARQRQLLSVREQLMALTVTTRSKDRTLTVTVGEQGSLRSIKFHGTDYRAMPPAELSAVLVETINTARQELMDKASDIFTPLRGMGSNFRDSMTGGSELDEALAPLLEELRSVVADEDVQEDQHE
jgi:DNA-binding protein YbaB